MTLDIGERFLIEFICDESEREFRDMTRNSECLCTARFARSDDIDPPEPTRNRRCPIHGDLKHVDPDAAREELLERD